MGHRKGLLRYISFQSVLMGLRVTEFKYLGVIFDEHLSWNEYVEEIVSKAGRRVALLGRVRCYITTQSANAIFYL